MGDDLMTADSFKDRFHAVPNPTRATFCFRLLFVIAILLIIAIWMDCWIRGELEIGEKTMEIAREKWGIGALAAGGLLYI
jgi:hypothetical protein